jgi:hypothetical protein
LEEKMDRKAPSSIMKFAILSVLLIGIGIASSMDATAQRRNRWDGYPNWGGSYQLRETALNAGFNEGSKEGRNDRSHNRYRNYSEFSAYNDATKDYSSRLGDRDLYQRYYQGGVSKRIRHRESGRHATIANQPDRIAITGIVTIKTIKLDNVAGDATGISMASLAARMNCVRQALNAGIQRRCEGRPQ